MFALSAASQEARARVLLTVEEALKLVFAEAAVERQTLYLSEAELERARELASGPVESALVTRYRAPGAAEAVAYFDSHRVRTLPETLMVVVGPDGRVRRVEVLSFEEPPDYLPRAAWYAQFSGRALDEELQLKRAIRPVSGATLTGRATLEAVRRVLALDRVLAERAQPDAASEPR